MRRVILLLAALFATTPLWAKPVTATQAATCKTQAVCAYFGDVLAGDRGFRTAVYAVFRGSGGKAPDWVARGVMTPLLPIQQGRELYLRGSVCQPHNCPHQLLVLYQPRRQQLVARYTREDGSQLWLGRPSAAQKALLQDENDPASPLSGKLTDSTPLPLVLP